METSESLKKHIMRLYLVHERYDFDFDFFLMKQK